MAETETSKKPDPKQKPGNPKKLPATSFGLSQYYVEDWSIFPEAGTKKEEVFDPNYLGHIANKIKAGSKIRIFPKDNSYYAEGHVHSVSNQIVIMEEILHKSFTAHSHDFDDGGPYKATFGSPIDKYRVVRKEDGHILRSGFETMEDAISYVLELKKTLRK